MRSREVGFEKTWRRHTAVEFRGWQRCADVNAGVRILISDEGPPVKRFGRHLDGVKGGMILNGTFKNRSPECQSEREFCIRAIAVHEFGHALGFAHEQNRPDTPGECAMVHGQGQTKEIPLTPYDPESVMNYGPQRIGHQGGSKDLWPALARKSVRSSYRDLRLLRYDEQSDVAILKFLGLQREYPAL
jgi:hypothetical protein